MKMSDYEKESLKMLHKLSIDVQVIKEHYNQCPIKHISIERKIYLKIIGTVIFLGGTSYPIYKIITEIIK